MLVGKELLYLLKCQKKSNNYDFQKVIQERRQRISFPEPSDGVPLRFKFPDGQLKTRRFLLSESIQVIFLLLHCMLFTVPN